jgi:hypothetical protein
MPSARGLRQILPRQTIKKEETGLFMGAKISERLKNEGNREGRGENGLNLERH